MIGKTIDELREGDHAELTRIVAGEDVARFIDAVGDDNPVHSDPAYAATTMFKAPIAPGIFTAGLISAVIGTRLPGPGAIYLSQSLRFTKPVFLGEIVRGRNRVRLQTACVNQRGEEVLAGEAWVMPSRTSIVYDRPRAGLATMAGWAVSPWTIAAQTVAAWSAFGLALVGGPRVTSASRR
jgi:acyl dehydratase